MEEDKPSSLFKIAVMGDAGVGKTSLIKRIARNIFSQHYDLTIGVDFALKKHSLPERDVNFQLWDIAGAERFGDMMRVYLRETAAVILVWDATRPATFDALPKYFPHIKDGLPIIFVRSKGDEDNKDKQDDFEARKATIAEWTAKRGMAAEDVAIVDTSSKDSLGIPELNKAMLGFVPQLIQKLTPPSAALFEVRREVPPQAAARVVQSSEPFFLVERYRKIQHSRKPRFAELNTCFKNEEPRREDITWLLLHLDSVEENCQTARDIRKYLGEVLLQSARPKAGPVVELLKLLDEEERAKFPKFVTLMTWASYSDLYIAERDVERKFILDVAKNIYLGKPPYEDLDESKVPKAVVDILEKHTNRNIPERK